MAQTSPSSEPGSLVCPACATTHPPSERFCTACGMPLVFAGREGEGEGDASVTARAEHARKIKPQYAEGQLVKVAGARNQAEAEFLQGLLLEEGVPSALRRARGFDVPDFLAAGPRDVLVPASGYGAARDVLLQAELDPVLATSDSGIDAPLRILVGVLIAVVLVALVAWVGTEIFV
jgi:hypothetical protein